MPNSGFSARGRLCFWGIALAASMIQSLPVAPAAAMDSETGMEGVILVGPVNGGPAKQGLPDSKPLAKTAFVVRGDDGVAGSFITDESGKFHVTLPAGHYVVTPRDRHGKIGDYGPFEVDLVRGQIKKVSWMCDTGMR
jgi:hypothetical protein